LKHSWLLITAVVSLIVAPLLGSYDLDFLLLLESFFSLNELSSEQEISRVIFFKIRFPRVLVVALCGASLAASGVLVQGFFQNPLVSPSVLGVTSGVVLGAVLCLSLGSVSSGVNVYSFVGSMLSTLTLLAIIKSYNLSSRYKIVLLGVAFSALFNALVSCIISYGIHDSSRSAVIFHWLMGGFAGVCWEHFYFATIVLLPCLFFSYRLTSSLDILSLGEGQAFSLGVDLDKLQRKIFVLTAFLVSVPISIAGGVPFVGLVVPHITRIIVGPVHKKLFLYSTINGVILTTWADILARSLIKDKEIEMGLITSLLGAPFFLWLVTRKR
jgi:iron complex transport system permease protein